MLLLSPDSLLSVTVQPWHTDTTSSTGCTRIFARQCLSPFKDEEGWSQAPEELPMPRTSETHCPSGTSLASLTSVPDTLSPGFPSPPVWLAVLAPTPAPPPLPLRPGSLTKLLPDQKLCDRWLLWLGSLDLASLILASDSQQEPGHCFWKHPNSSSRLTGDTLDKGQILPLSLGLFCPLKAQLLEPASHPSLGRRLFNSPSILRNTKNRRECF